MSNKTLVGSGLCISIVILNVDVPQAAVALEMLQALKCLRDREEVYGSNRLPSNILPFKIMRDC